MGYVRIDGTHDSQERLMAVQRFRSQPGIRVALLSITAAAVGEHWWAWAGSYQIIMHGCRNRSDGGHSVACRRSLLAL